MSIQPLVLAALAASLGAGIVQAADAPASASVTLAPTASHQAQGVSGELVLAQDADGVRVTGQVRGLQANSEHGFHVHEKGDCSAPDGSSAGGHFNPAAQPHGDPRGSAHHAGDILNIKADAEGVAKVDAQLEGARLDGDNALVGRAFIVHAKPDDYASQPAGNAGDRVACGVVVTN